MRHVTDMSVLAHSLRRRFLQQKNMGQKLSGSIMSLRRQNIDLQKLYLSQNLKQIMKRKSPNE